MKQITVDLLNEALNAATPQADGKYSIVDVFNAAQKLAEANAEQEQYSTNVIESGLTVKIPDSVLHDCNGKPLKKEQTLISAEEARKLGAGKAEWFDCAFKQWKLCTPDICNYHPYFKYRAIEQEPVGPLKQVSWKDVPVGVLTNKGKLRAYASDLVWCETKKHGCPSLAGYTPSQLELAPASEQKWIAAQGDFYVNGDFKPVDGIDYELTYMEGTLMCVNETVACFKVVGIKEGYELK